MATQAKQPPSVENKPSNVAVDINIPAVKSPYTQDFIIEQQRKIREGISGKRTQSEEGIQSSLQGLESAMVNTQGQNRALAQAGVTGVLPEELQGALQQYAGPSSMGLMDELRRSRIGGQQRILGQQLSDIDAGETARVSTGRTALERQAQAVEQEALLGEAQLAQQQEQAIAEQNLNLINAYYDAIDAQEKRQIEFQKEILNTNKDLFKFYGTQEFQQFQNELDSQQKAVDLRVEQRNEANKLKQELLQNGLTGPGIDKVLEAQTVEDIYNVQGINKFYRSTLERLQEAKTSEELTRIRKENAIINSGLSMDQADKIISKDQFKKADGALFIQGQLSNFKDKLREFYQTPDTNIVKKNRIRKELETAREITVAYLAEPLNKGVLQDAEKVDLLKTMEVPTGRSVVGAAVTQFSPVGFASDAVAKVREKKAIASVDTMSNILQENFNANINTIEKAYPGATEYFFPDITYQNALNTPADELVADLVGRAETPLTANDL